MEGDVIYRNKERYWQSGYFILKGMESVVYYLTFWREGHGLFVIPAGLELTM